MLWLKALHISFMVTWFAGLFYLPRLFVYHAMSDDAAQRETFKIMERKLLIMTHIGGTLTLFFGVWLLSKVPSLMGLGWMQLKLVFVLALLLYHGWCMKLVADFRQDKNSKSHRWYRLFNEVPVLFLFAIVILVVVRPF